MFLKYTLLFIVFACLLSSSCKPSVSTSDATIKKEIEALTTNELKTQYLENIYLQDQNDRKEDMPGLQMMKNDQERLARIKVYLETYGYPDRRVLGGPSADAPYLVYHHIGTPKENRAFFPYIYQAYLDQNIAPETLAFFLGRYQRYANGSWLDFDRPFTTEEEIDTLVYALGLEPIANKLDEEHK